MDRSSTAPPKSESPRSRRSLRSVTMRHTIVAMIVWGMAPGACRDPSGPSSAVLTPLWKTTLPVPPEQYWLGRPAADAQRVFVEAGNLLFALDATSGQIRWQHQVRIAPAPPPTVPLVDGGRVFLAEVDSTFALDANTGATIWTFHPDSQGVAVPAVDAASIYIGQRGNPTVYALDKTTGTLRWRVDLSQSYVFPAAVMGLATRAGVVYAAVWRDKSISGNLSSGVLVALNASDGHELWRYETSGDRGSFVAEPLLLSDAVIVNNYAGVEVTSIDMATHTVRWRSPMITAVLTADAGSLYGGGNNGDAYGMDAGDGATKWVTPLGSSASGIAACGGSIWESSGNLHRVDAASGAETGRLGVRGLDTFISDIGTANNRIFIAGGPYVWAFDCQ